MNPVGGTGGVGGGLGKKQPMPAAPEAPEAQEAPEAPEEEWEFRCVCGIHGHNYDDGLPMVQCCECNCWSHTACVKYRMGSTDEFVCRWCKERKKKSPSMKYG